MLCSGSTAYFQSMNEKSNSQSLNQTKSLSMLTVNQLPRLGTTTTSLTRMMATKSDQELGKFLLEEVSTEKKNHRSLPKLDGWNVKTEGSEVTLTRDVAGGEQVMITLNVNHTVDSAQPDDGSEEVNIATNIYQLKLFFFFSKGNS